MNWLSLALRILSMVPTVVVSVEQIAKASNVSGTTKKQLALASLGLAAGVAQNLSPEHQNDIDAATTLASNAIDSTVAVYNFVGKFTKSGSDTATVAPSHVTTITTPVTESHKSTDAVSSTGSVVGGFAQ